MLYSTNNFLELYNIFYLSLILLYSIIAFFFNLNLTYSQLCYTQLHKHDLREIRKFGDNVQNAKSLRGAYQE